MKAGPEAPPRIQDERNLMGWFVFGVLVLFVIAMQLASYLDRTPSVDVLRARIEQQLQAEVAAESVAPNAAAQTPLEQAAKDLQPNLAEDPETALLYAAVQTERGVAPTPRDLISLRASNEGKYRAGYEIYTAPALAPDRARELAKTVGSDSFLYRLVGVQALEKAKVPRARDSLAGGGDLSRKLLAVAGIGLLVVLGAGLLLIFVSLRGTGVLRPLGLPMGWLAPPDADRYAVRASQIFSAYLAVSLFGSAVLRSALDKSASGMLVYLAIIAAVLLLFRVPVSGKWITPREIGLSRENLGRHILWGIGGAVANLPIVFVIQLVSSAVFRGLPPPEHPATVELTDTHSIWVILQLAFAASVAAPIMEEILFRGTLFPAVSSALRSPIAGGVLSSLIFAAIHPTGIPAWPALAAIGGMSCVLVYHTKSLVPSIVMHAVHNFGTLLFGFLLLR